MIPLFIDCEATPEAMKTLQAALALPSVELKGVSIFGKEAINIGVSTAYGAEVPLLSDVRPGRPTGLSEKRAVELLAETVRTETDLVLCCLGPLTNIAAFVLCYPELKEKLKTCIVLGGAVFGGNATPCAEWNFFRDPEAAAIVIDSGLPLTVIPLEASDFGRWALPLLLLEELRAVHMEKHNMRVEVHSIQSRGCSVTDLLNRDKRGTMVDIVTGADEEALKRLIESVEGGERSGAWQDEGHH